MELLTTTARCRRCRRRATRAWLARLCALALLCSVAPRASALPAISDEYRLKAVFLFNFAQFVEWPAHAFPQPDAPLVIGVLGDDPFGPYLDELVSGEKVGDHPLIVRRSKHAADLAGCHIVFISRSEAAALGRDLAELKGRSVLTISDLDTFTRAGGMVRFVTENGKIRLRIDVDAARACGLRISSKILRPSTIVTAGKD